LNESFLSRYTDIKNVIVIGSSGFTGCPTDFESYVSSLLSTMRSRGNPYVVFRSVGVIPDIAGRDYLSTFGITGGGGYTEWV
jgi:hypothetical protein